MKPTLFNRLIKKKMKMEGWILFFFIFIKFDFYDTGDSIDIDFNEKKKISNKDTNQLNE